MRYFVITNGSGKYISKNCEHYNGEVWAEKIDDAMSFFHESDAYDYLLNLKEQINNRIIDNPVIEEFKKFTHVDLIIIPVIRLTIK